jgi:sulfate adenylyltransferase subunit 2
MPLKRRLGNIACELELVAAVRLQQGAPTSEQVERLDGEDVFTETVRFRTVGDMTITGATKSTAVTLDEVIAEIATADVTERGASRADDRFTEAAMGDRKKEGYF